MKLINIAGFVFYLTLISACEDSSTLDFKEEYYVEAFLIVGEPIQDIRVQRTQSVSTPFQYANGGISDATVRMFIGENPIPVVLSYRPDTTGAGIGDYVSLLDTIRAETRYRLEVTFKDGKTLTGESKTPKQIEWIRPPNPMIQFPQQSGGTSTPDSLRFSWSSESPTTEYIIRVTCLDTTHYGVYLNPSTTELNTRTWVDTDAGDDTRFNARVVWGFFQGTSSPTVWAAFKWYGRHEIVMYAADKNFINWFKFLRFQTNPQFDNNFSNMRGNGKGIIGSASVVKQQLFVLKEAQ